MSLRIIIRIFCKALCAASLSKWQVWSQGLGSRGECLAIYALQRDDNYIEIGLPGRKLDKAIRAYPGIQLIWTWATRPAALTNWTFFQSVLTHATGLDELCCPQCFCSAAISSFPRTLESQIVQEIFSISGGYIDCTNCIMYSADLRRFTACSQRLDMHETMRRRGSALFEYAFSRWIYCAFGMKHVRFGLAVPSFLGKEQRK